jgi:hypothetical protein
MGRGPAGHVEEIPDRQRDAAERWKVLDGGAVYDRIRCGRSGGPDVVVGPVAERVELRVEFVHPLQVTINDLKWAHLLAADDRGEFEGRHKRIDRVAHRQLSFVFRGAVAPVSLPTVGWVLEECRGPCATGNGSQDGAWCVLEAGPGLRMIGRGAG